MSVIHKKTYQQQMVKREKMRLIIFLLLFNLISTTNLLLGVSWAGTKNVPDVCPQERNVTQAPSEYLKKVSPLRKEPRHIKKGKVLSHIKAKPLACKHCHGLSGNGMGAISKNMNPKPRNFTCKQTMDEISDGQLFWIIKNGAKGAAMPAYSYLSDKKIWQLIHYIRSLSDSTS